MKFVNIAKKISNNYSKTKVILIIALFFLLVLVYIQSTYTFIGRGDYANYSNVARNLILGRGFTNDYIAFHYIYYPQISHPEDMWPLLQSVWIAISYLFLGINPFAARVPNAIFLTVLALLTYFIGKKLYNAKVGFWAAVLTGLNSNLILYSTDWITADIALAVFSLIIFYLGYLVIEEAKKQQVSLIKVLWLGIFCGLAILQKPMGVLLPAIYFFYLLYFYRDSLRAFLLPAVVLTFGTLVFAGPFLVRNYLLFGTFLLPNEGYMGYLIKYFPYEKVFSIYYGDPPSIKLWLDYGWLNFLKINFSYFRYSIDTFVYRDLLMPYTVIVLSLLGLSTIKSREKHFYLPGVILFLVMSFLMATYWHYESRYYAMLIPVFNLLSTVFFLSLFPKINWKNGLVVLTILMITFLPSVKMVLNSLQPKPTDTALINYTWIKNNTPKDAVIMTLAPWEMNFHSERKTIMIPNEDKSQILWMARKYKSDYLEIEFLNEVKRDSLKELYKGIGTTEFVLIYQDPGNSYIYKINWPKIKLDEKSKPSWY